MGRLTSLSDSDPGALADYMLALLRHEKPRDELKAFCINQLGDFLHERKPRFIRQVILYFFRNGMVCGEYFAAGRGK